MQKEHKINEIFADIYFQLLQSLLLSALQTLLFLLFLKVYLFLVSGTEQAMPLLYPAFQNDCPGNLLSGHTFRDIQLPREWFVRLFAEHNYIKSDEKLLFATIFCEI